MKLKYTAISNFPPYVIQSYVAIPRVAPDCFKWQLQIEVKFKNHFLYNTNDLKMSLLPFLFSLLFVYNLFVFQIHILH